MKFLIALFLVFGGIATKAQAQKPEIRFVVIQKAGKNWNSNLSIFDQPYILSNPDPNKPNETHVKHYARLLAAGKLALGGPFPKASGAPGTEVGMMVPTGSMTEREIGEFAAKDPAVVAGVLDFEVRPWMIGMKAP